MMERVYLILRVFEFGDGARSAVHHMVRLYHPVWLGVRPAM